jgi:hypothetical protein
MDFILLLAFSSWFSVLIPLAISLFKIGLEREMSWLRGLLIFSFSCDLVGYWLATSGHNNLFLANFFFLSQYAVLLIIFSFILTDTHRYFYYFLGVIVAVSFLLNLLSGHSKAYIDSYSAALSSLAILFLSVRFFMQMLVSLPTQEIHKYPLLWIVIAVFFYYSGTLLLFVINNYLVISNPSLHKVVWAFHNFLNITKNLLFAVALWMNLRKAN